MNSKQQQGLTIGIVCGTTVGIVTAMDPDPAWKAVVVGIVVGTVVSLVVALVFKFLLPAKGDEANQE